MPDKANLGVQHQTGSYPCVADKAALELARALHDSESLHCVTSWSAQERAQAFYNERGLGATLDEIQRLLPLGLHLENSDGKLRPDGHADLNKITLENSKC